MDYLPSPVLGTFWPYSSSTDAKLAGVVAGQRRVLVEQTALSLAELLEGTPARTSSSRRRRRGRTGSRFDTPARSSAFRSGAPRSSPTTGPARRAASRSRERHRHPRPDYGRREGCRIDAIQDVTFKTAAQEQSVARGVPQSADAEARLGDHASRRPRPRSASCICRRACAGFPPTRSRSTATAAQRSSSRRRS